MRQFASEHDPSGWLRAFTIGFRRYVKKRAITKGTRISSAQTRINPIAIVEIIKSGTAIRLNV